MIKLSSYKSPGLKVLQSCKPERKNPEIIDYQSIFCQYKSEVNGAS
jgi:hypothetical protein